MMSVPLFPLLCPKAIVLHKSMIGKIGNTGNAKGKHHFYTIASVFPQGDCLALL